MAGLVTGTTAVLASITQASGFVGPMGALIIGRSAGILCPWAVGVIKTKLNIDDTLDVFAVHGVGGIFGTVMAPLLAVAPLANGQGRDTQLMALLAVGAFSIVMTFIIAKLCTLIYPMRVSEVDEQTGLDLATHGERAYDIAS